MAQNGVIFHLLRAPVPFFIEESWPLGKCRPVFFTLPNESACVSIVLSLYLFLLIHRRPDNVYGLFFYFLKSQLCNLFTLMLSYLVLPFLLLLPFWPTLRKAIFCQKCNSGLWLRVRQGFWCRCESALSLKLPASITGTAAECQDGPLWAQAFHTSELYAWRLVWIAVSECINHIVPHQLDYAGLQLSTFTSLAIANSKPARTRQTCTGFPAVSSGRKEKRCFCGSQPTPLYSDVSPIDFLPQMTDVTVSLCQRSH